VDVDYARQGVLSVGTSLNGDPEDRLCLLDSDPKVTLLVRYDKSTLHRNNQPTRNNLLKRTEPMLS
jgi:hypothetical protein